MNFAQISSLQLWKVCRIIDHVRPWLRNFNFPVPPKSPKPVEVEKFKKVSSRWGLQRTGWGFFCQSAAGSSGSGTTTLIVPTPPPILIQLCILHFSNMTNCTFPDILHWTEPSYYACLPVLTSGLKGLGCSPATLLILSNKQILKPSNKFGDGEIHANIDLSFYR